MVNNSRYIEREIEPKIRKHLSSPEIIAIVGPRQSGKTTLMSRIFDSLERAVFITFEDIEKLSLFETDLKTFMKIFIQPYGYIFIDEFQYSEHGGKHLKSIYDTVKNKKIIISGSSAVDLTIKALSYLVGRVLVFELFPFSFGEFLSTRDPAYCRIYRELRGETFNLGKPVDVPDISSAVNRVFNGYLKEYILYGGFPRVVLEEDIEEKKFLLKNIANTYLLKDFREIGGFSDDITVLKLIKALSLQIGNLVEYNELSQLTAASHYTVKKYIDFLKKTFILELIPPYFTNKRTELVKNPKTYFIDTGLRNSVINDFKPLESRVDKGSLQENFIFTHLKRGYDEIKFWRSKGGNEVDFILEIGVDVFPLEIKSRIKSLSMPRSLSYFVEKYSPPKVFLFNDNTFGKRALVPGTEAEKRNSEVLFLPLWMV